MQLSNEKFKEQITFCSNSDEPQGILVTCNNISRILSITLDAANEIKSHEVYYQPNTDFYASMEIDEIITFEDYKQKFEDFCNYFDKHRQTLISRVKKRLFNYSKDCLEEVYIEYPSDKKIILVVENFNFWDFNSQHYFAQLSSTMENIVVVGQIRTDFNFAVNHIDIGIRSGKGSLKFFELNE